MTFLIADTFTDSLGRLTGDEQKAVKTTAFDLQMDPASPGLSFHKLDKARDKRFWSVRVNSDIRLIVHRTDTSLLLCYVDHHDRAYAWGERRKLENHPTTGAAQIVDIRSLPRRTPSSRRSSRHRRPRRHRRNHRRDSPTRYFLNTAFQPSGSRTFGRPTRTACWR